MYEAIFIEVSSKSNGFIIDLFVTHFEIFQNTQKETFFLLESEFQTAGL